MKKKSTQNRILWGKNWEWTEHDGTKIRLEENCIWLKRKWLRWIKGKKHKSSSLALWINRCFIQLLFLIMSMPNAFAHIHQTMCYGIKLIWNLIYFSFCSSIFKKINPTCLPKEQPISQFENSEQMRTS